VSATHRYEVRRPTWARGGLEVLSRRVKTSFSEMVAMTATPTRADTGIELVLAVKSGDLVLSRPFTKSEMSPAWGELALTDMDKAQVARFAEGARPAEMQATVLAVIGKIFDGRVGGQIAGVRDEAVLPDWEYDLTIWVSQKTWTPTASAQFTDRQIEALKDLLENLREAIRPTVRDSGAGLARDPGECQVRYLAKRKSESWRAEYPGFEYLISPASVKIDKSNAAQTRYLNAVMYLAPATMAGGPNLCPCHTEGCFGEAGENCIAGTGQLSMTPDVLIGRSKFFFGDPKNFHDRLVAEIEHFLAGARKCGRKLAMRLNGTSDVNWEARPMFRELFARFPDVTFYDYSKVASRVVRGGKQVRLPENYHLTFSLSEDNDEAALQVAAHTDVNIAVVFDLKPPRGEFPGDPLPATFGGRRVIDGDKHDLRFLDPAGVVVGLRLKTYSLDRRAQMVMMGFVKQPRPVQIGRRA
jgi:hypothetical protein